MERGGAATLRHAFHQMANAMGHFDGSRNGPRSRMSSRPTRLFRRISSKPSRSQGTRGTVLVVNVWAGLDLRDSLTLLKHDGRWHLVGKVFRRLH
ncbi:MAG: nuclear transport factor 2 family protein [Defluviimonas sp.]|nr:nuclear transport factor 2 family protein [Defluviimonas sp.]